MQPTSSLALRQTQQQISSLAVQDLNQLWAGVTNPVDGRIQLQAVLPVLVDTYGQISAVAAAEWYSGAREAAHTPGTFVAVPASIPDSATDALALWATSVGSSLQDIATLVAGGLTRRVVNFGRLTVVQSAIDDPGSEGWMRVGFGECDWCKQYLDGEVHYVEGYDFKAHDHCHCQAIPVFKGAALPAAVLPQAA